MKTKIFIPLTICSLFLFSKITIAQWIQTNGPYGAQYVSCMTLCGNTLFAGTLNGVFVSSDNGNFWAQTSGLTNYNVKSMLVDDTNVFVGSNYSGVFLLNNNGSSWTIANTGLPSDNSVLGLASKDSLLFVGLNSGSNNDGVFMSSNNGNSWIAVNNGLPLNNMQHYDIMGLGVRGNKIFTQPRMSGMFVSEDDGNSWNSINNGFQNDPNSFAFISNDSGIYVGNSYGVFYSNNNGAQWTKQNNVTNDGVLSLAISGSNIFAGTNSGVYLSTDNGLLWTNISTNGIASLSVTSFAINGTYIFAGTSNGEVWKRPLSEITSINTNNEPIIFSLYPNPSKGNFTIETDEKDSFLNIVNMLGISTYQSYLKEQKTNIDLSEYPNGVYFIKVESKRGTSIKKIILNK